MNVNSPAADERRCRRNERTARMATIATTHAPNVLLPLRFIAAGLLALAIAVTWLVAEPSLITSYHYGPQAVAFAHLVLLGFVGSVVMGVIYQLTPVALEARLHSERLASVQFWFHLAGVAGMVWMFKEWNMKQVGHFGSIFATGVVLFVWNIVRTLLRVPRWNVIAVGMSSAVGWLAVTSLAGLFVACVKCWPWLSPFAPLAQMHAHAHLGGLGVFVLLIVAVSYRLVPMFAVSTIRSERRATSSIILLNIGVAGLAVTILFGSPWKLAFAMTSIAALTLFAVELIAILRARKRTTLDWGLRYFLTGVALLAPLCALALVLCWPGLPTARLTTQLENAYAILAILGVLAFAILGMLFKILPFLIWFHRYADNVGRGRVPSLMEMVSPRLQAIGYAMHVPGVLIAAAASVLGHEHCARVAAVLMAGSVALFLINGGIIGSHLLRRRVEEPPISIRPVHASA